MTDHTSREDRTYSLQPVREYHIPGGPYARSLGKVEVKLLAEIRRGSAEDTSGRRST